MESTVWQYTVESIVQCIVYEKNMEITIADPRINWFR